MVQFGKTESNTTNNTTVHDTGDKSTRYVLDKTSQQFINVKDIITTTNVYRNMDMTLMAATLALSIAAPIINGLIQKAINRWNDEVPEKMQPEADDEMLLLKLKIAAMGEGLGSKIDVSNIRSVNVRAVDFFELQKEISEYMKTMTDYATKEMIEGFCKKDKPRITRGEVVLMRLHESFGTSIQSAMTHDPSAFMIGNFKYDHAIECLERIVPSAMMCSRNSFLVRKMITVTHLNLMSSQVSEIEERLSPFYTIKVQKFSEDDNMVILFPRQGEVTVNMLSVLYGLDLTLLKNAHFFSMKSRQSWYLINDPNLSIEAILETKLGHSIAVLGEVIEEIATHAAGIMRENNPHDDLQNLFLEADKGPFKRKIRMRQFANPLSLFSVNQDDDLLALDRNFKVMTALIRICGTIKVHYPSLIRKSDRELDEYIFRMKVVGDRSYGTPESFLSPTAPYVQTIMGVETNADRSELTMGQTIRDVPSRLYPQIEEVTDPLTTGIDDLFSGKEIGDKIPKGLLTLRQLSQDVRKQLQKVYKETCFMVVRVTTGKSGNQYKLRFADTDSVHEIMGNLSMKPSYEYKNLLWYVKGDKLFDGNNQFTDGVINKDVLVRLT